MQNNIFYFQHINVIGGIETFLYQLAQKYKDWDITIYYKTGDMAQIRRLQKFVRTVQYRGETIVCKKAFFNFNLDIIDNVIAEEYIQIAHGDYKAMGIKPNTHPKITRYIGVTQLVCDTFEEVTGFKTEFVGDPFVPIKPRKVLNLISATRLSREKGKSRMIKLANALDKADIPYTWTIFTNDTNAIDNEKVIYRKPRLDILDYVANSDYLVQLSDNEGYCYSVVEALSVGTPVIVTACPVFKEIGVNEHNGFILDFDMADIPVDKIYKGLPNFTYRPKEDRWNEFLVPGKSAYQDDLKSQIQVQILGTYRDLYFDRMVNKNEIFMVPKLRGEELIRAGFAKEIPIDIPSL